MTSFQIRLLARGPNIAAVAKIETELGGDPRRAVPYLLPQALSEKDAISRSEQLRNLGADTEVVSSGTEPAESPTDGNIVISAEAASPDRAVRESDLVFLDIDDTVASEPEPASEMMTGDEPGFGGTAEFPMPASAGEAEIGPLEAAPGFDDDQEMGPHTGAMALPSARPSPPAASAMSRPRATTSGAFHAQPRAAVEKEAPWLVDVFYATNRARSASKDLNEFYGDRRCETPDCELGACQVSIPPGHRWGDLERPSWLRLQFRENPEKHVVLLAVTPMAVDAFYHSVRLLVDQSNERDALLFIHGYNVSFAEAVRRTAQLSFDLKFPGAPIAFCWPSRGRSLSYPADAATIGWTNEYLQNFLVSILDRVQPQRLHVIAHSMGSRALAEALRWLTLQQGRKLPQLHEVVFAAPDVDRGLFLQLAGAMAQSARRVTLYASSRDQALVASRKLHEAQRAGDIYRDGPIVAAGIETIDASRAAADLLGHSYVGSSPSVVGDLSLLIRNGMAADQRPELLPKRRKDKLYWYFRPKRRGLIAALKSLFS